MGPIEPAAITAATLLATKALEALGGTVGESTWAGMGRLIALVRHKVTGHRQAETVLAKVEQHPADQNRVRDLAEVLAAFAAKDAVFHRELDALIAQAKQDPAMGAFATRVEGLATVGQIVNLAQVRDVHFHLPAPTTLPAQPTTAAQVRWPTRNRTISNLSPRNPNFTGRDQLLHRLDHDLNAAEAAAVVQARALHGLGGVGKTHLVLEYAHRHASDYDLIWWITADQPAAIPDQLATLARRLGIPEHVEQAEAIAMLLDELRHHDRWLLVFDNAEDSRDLLPYWPPGGGGRVLVTSRNPAWGGVAVTVGLDVLPRGEAVTFLRHRASLDQQRADSLAEALGDLPLALEQAAAYLDETATPVGDYLALLGTHARELFALGQPVTSEQTIATTWTVSLQRLRQQAPAAEDLLVLCAFLAAEDIPRTLPTQHPDVLPERLAVTVGNPLTCQQIIGALRRYALVKTSKDALSVHRLVQAVTRHELDPDQEQHWASTALQLIRAAFPVDPTDPDAWPVYARLLPHALAVISHAEAAGIDPETTAWLLNETGSYLWQRGDHQQARELHRRALAIREAYLGPDHLDTAHSLSHLASVLRDQGDLDHAHTLYERALAIREAHLGPDHPDTAQSLNNLARVLRDQSDLDTARTYLERALAIDEAGLGPDHLDTAHSLSHLATILRDQGDLMRARILHERALTIRESRLGTDHLDTARSLNSLAGVLHAQGDLDTAQTLYQRALAIRQSRLGPDHLDTAHSLSHLASVLHDQDDLHRARTLHENALAIREVHLGADHPTTAHSLNNLAGVLRDQGDLDGASRLFERALAIRETRLGPDHPDTARTLNNLASVLGAQGDLAGARLLLERAVAIHEARLGPDHPGTVQSRHRLAAVVAELNKQQ